MRLAALLAACAVAAAQAQPAAPPLALDLHEQVLRLPVTVKDLYGREETREIALTVFKPDGSGPFPLAVVSHGRAPADRRAGQGRQRYEHFARYLVGKGFTVMVPTRVGYGDTYGDFDPESSGSCQMLRPQAAAEAAADQVLAAVAHARTLPWVDASRWVAMGQSMGGLATLAVVARHPPGLVAAVNFSGGLGGDPETRPGNPCSPSAIRSLVRQLAGGAQVPMLWLYWHNDRYWGPDIPRSWAEAWAAGGGQASFRQLPDAGSDGHAGLGEAMDQWVPLVEAYLAGAGFERPGTITRPPASGFAAVGDADKVPVPLTARAGLYQRFLAAKAPRAFAVSPQGAAGFAAGDWAMGRALGYCQARRGVACRLYAVDDDVVWVP